MDSKTFKKIASLLTEVYREVKQEAINIGFDLFSPEYDQLIAKAREKVLESQGFTLQQYREAKAKVSGFSQADMVGFIEDTSLVVDEIKNTHIPNHDEIAQIAHKVAKEYIKPPQIINQIVREVTIEKPQIVKETIIEKTVETINYNDKPILQQLEDFDKRLKEIQIAPPIDIESIKADLKLDFGKMLNHNIDIMGMPDFRKLAMGLQGQIDALGKGSATWVTGTPSGTVNSINVTFTLPGTPTANSLFLFLNGQYLTAGGVDYTLSGLTITMVTAPDSGDVFTYKYS